MVSVLHKVIWDDSRSSGELWAMNNGILRIDHCRDAMCELLCKSRRRFAKTQLLVSMPRFSHGKWIVSGFILTIN